MVSGTSNPSITNDPNYYGEPSLSVPGGTSVFSGKDVIKGDSAVSFQFAVDANGSKGIFEITSSDGGYVASISIIEGNVNVSTFSSDGILASETSGNLSGANTWTLVSGNLFNYNNSSGSGWRLQLFVDNTSYVFANISAPIGYSYDGIEMASSNGTTYFTNIIFSTYRMSLFLPGYNNMEGYGQGSGAVVKLLNPFYVLHANFILYNWSVERYSTLSFQINAMNLYGAEHQTSKGFFQLGIDLDPNGKIAPWYVANNNAIAVYFSNHPSPDFMPGFQTPNGTVLGLTIQYDPHTGLIEFQIVDYSVNNQYRYWNTSVAYDGSPFYAAYTQIETSAMNSTQMVGYRFNGSMYNLSYGSNESTMIQFNSSYMLPFSIDAPSIWSLTYYDDSTAGYLQMD